MIKKKCIGILTSGGDAPGMNAAIRAVVNTAIHNDMRVLGILKGFNGLLHEEYIELKTKSVSNIIQYGGTILKTARCNEFYDEYYRKKAYYNCINTGIDYLVVIGGDGSFNGAKALSELGIPCVGIPATIDNDIACTEYTIGYDTALNTIVNAVDKLCDTSQSHERCSVVEVMGRHAGHLALNTGIASGAACIITEEVQTPLHEVERHIIEARKSGWDHYIVVISEGYGNPQKIAALIQKKTGIDTRATILGHVQRGGSPSLRDRVVASQIGHYAVKLLQNGIGNRVLAMKQGKIIDFNIQEALVMKKGLDMDLYYIMKDLSF